MSQFIKDILREKLEEVNEKIVEKNGEIARYRKKADRFKAGFENLKSERDVLVHKRQAIRDYIGG